MREYPISSSPDALKCPVRPSTKPPDHLQCHPRQMQVVFSFHCEVQRIATNEKRLMIIIANQARSHPFAVINGRLKGSGFPQRIFVR